jgi:hypothetical protein
MDIAQGRTYRGSQLRPGPRSNRRPNACKLPPEELPPCTGPSPQAWPNLDAPFLGVPPHTGLPSGMLHHSPPSGANPASARAPPGPPPALPVPAAAPSHAPASLAPRCSMGPLPARTCRARSVTRSEPVGHGAAGRCGWACGWGAHRPPPIGALWALARKCGTSEQVVALRGAAELRAVDRRSGRHPKLPCDWDCEACRPCRDVGWKQALRTLRRQPNKRGDGVSPTAERRLHRGKGASRRWEWVAHRTWMNSVGAAGGTVGDLNAGAGQASDGAARHDMAARAGRTAARRARRATS